MRILVIGTGAMGSLFGGMLQKNGVDVTLFNHRSNAHVKAIQKDGLSIIGKEERSTKIKLEIITETDNLPRNYDLILLLVKTYATETILDNILPILEKEIPILTLQNGIGNIEKIKKLVPNNNNVFVGGTYQGASVKEPGVILHQGWGKTFIGSDQSGMNNKLLQDIASTFSNSGFQTDVSENVQSIIWSKLLVNIAYNGLTAVTRLRNGDTILTEEGKYIVGKLIFEAVQIAKAKGIPLLYEDPIKECLQLGQKDIAMNISSMLSDVLHHRKTEIDAINGAIVEEGKKFNIATPYNDMITNLVKVIEGSYSKII